MTNISAVVLTRNSADVLSDCLKSLSFCKEIVVVDDNSSDATLEIAKKFGAMVMTYSQKSFAKKREAGAQKAKNDWILYVDSDERISEELKKSIQNMIVDNNISVGILQRKNFYLGNNLWPKIERLERLFKKETLKGWQGEVHESPIFEGDAEVLNGFLLHYTHQNLEQMVEKTREWSAKEAKLRLDANHPKMSAWRFFRVMITGCWDSYIKQSGWKAGAAGIVESMYQGFSMFITYAKLWELQQNEK